MSNGRGAEEDCWLRPNQYWRYLGALGGRIFTRHWVFCALMKTKPRRFLKVLLSHLIVSLEAHSITVNFAIHYWYTSLCIQEYKQEIEWILWSFQMAIDYKKVISWQKAKKETNQSNNWRLGFILHLHSLQFSIANGWKKVCFSASLLTASDNLCNIGSLIVLHTLIDPKQKTGGYVMVTIWQCVEMASWCIWQT